MLKKTAAVTAIALGLLFVAPAHANANSYSDSAQNRDGLFMGANYSMLKLNINGGELTPSMFVLSAGYQFSSYVALEGRFGVGMAKDTNVDLLPSDPSIAPYDEQVALDQYLGAYLKLAYPFSEYFTAYTLVGFTRLKLEMHERLRDIKGTTEENGYSYGFGVNLSNHKNVYLNLEYLHLQKESNVVTSNQFIGIREYDAETISLGLTYKF